MEIVYVFMYVMIPSFLLALIVSFYLLRKINLGYRILFTLILAIAIGYISPCFLVAFNKVRCSYLAHNEFRYLKMALAGKYSKSEINTHYLKHRLFDYEYSEIYRQLTAHTKSIASHKAPESGVTKLVIQPQILPVLIDSIQKEPELIGLLSVLPETPVDLKRKIANNTNEKAVLPMAENERTPPEILLILAKHESIYVSRVVYENQSAPIAARYIYYIRAPNEDELYLNYNKVLPPKFVGTDVIDLWISLAKDKREYVRLWVAKSEIAPPQVLEMMANDDSKEVLKWVFLNQNALQPTRNLVTRILNTTHDKLVLELSADNDRCIRKALAHSKVATEGILTKLSHDIDYQVIKAAKESLGQQGQHQ